MLPRALTSLLVLFLAPPLFLTSLAANELTGRITSVPDGNTVILHSGKVSHVLRLAWVEAPERHQPYSRDAQRALQRLALGRNVTFEWDKQDPLCLAIQAENLCPKFGRLMVNGADINLEMIRRGMVWHDPRTVSEQSTTDRELYPHEQREAQKVRRGLWAQKSPVPPWDYRDIAEQLETPKGAAPPAPAPKATEKPKAAPKTKGKPRKPASKPAKKKKPKKKAADDTEEATEEQA